MKLSVLYIIILVFLLQTASFAQKQDSLMVVQRIAEAEELIHQGSYAIAEKKLEEAYRTANLNFWILHKGQCAHLLGDLYAKQHDSNNSLEQYIKAVQLFQSINQAAALNQTHLSIAKLYTQQSHYPKAIEFYEKVEEYRENNNEINSINFLKLMATLNTLTGNYEKTRDYLTKITVQVKEQEKAKYFIWFAKVYQQIQNQEDALRMIDVAQKYATTHDSITLVEVLNAKAVLLKRTGKTREAETVLQQALNVLKTTPNDHPLKATLHKNIGIAYTNLESYARAKENYNLALEHWTLKQDKTKIAQTLNLIAANYYLSGSQEQARTNTLQAIKIAKPINDYASLAESYEIMSRIAKSAIEAQRYTKLKTAAEEQQTKITQNQNAEKLAQKVEIESIESEIQKRIVQQLETDRKLQQLAIESENRKRDIAIKANELALLKREKQIREIELRNKELARQQATRKLEAAKAQAMANEFKRQEEIQRLLVSKRDAEKKERDQQIELLQKEKTLQTLQLQEDANTRKYLVSGFLFILIILLIVGISLYIARRNSKKLKQKNALIEEQKVELQGAHQEIVVQNEELTQFQEELTLQRDNLSERNKELDKQNKKVAQSIRSATIIQSAILMPTEQIKQILTDHFILFWPKDVVSGDFYWMTQINGRKFVAAVDCTGHGVPGALMSLIANSLLNKLIKIEGNTDPGQILTLLHEEVHDELKQETSGNSDGMDMALVALSEQDDIVCVEFAGAKRPLHYIPSNGDKIQQQDGDRISIGGKSKKERIFTTKTLNLPKDSLLFLSSDGYSDQNDKNRKRFGNKRFMELLEKSHKKSMLDQRTDLEIALTNQIKDTEQRDDILVIGIRV